MRELPFKVGDEIKNYKEMCKLLDEKERTGNSKKSQFKRWQEVFQWELIGYRFKITAIHQKMFPSHDDNRVGQSIKTYNQYIQLLILDALHYFQEENKYQVSLNISHKGLIGIINLFNQVFYKLSFDKKYRLKISEELNIKEAFLRDFFQRMNSTAKNDVESALKQLQRKGLIYVNDIQLVKPSEPYELGIPVNQIAIMNEFFGKYNHHELTDKFTKNYGVIAEPTYEKNIRNRKFDYYQTSRVATDFEQSGILLCKNVALANLELNNNSHAYALDKTEELQKEISRLTRKYLGINYSYQGFQIVFSKPVLKKKSTLHSFQLEMEDIKQLQIDTQKAFKDTIETNYEKRYIEGIEKIENSESRVLVEGLNNGDSLIGEKLCTPSVIPYTTRILHSIETQEDLELTLENLFKLVLKDL